MGAPARSLENIAMRPALAAIALSVCLWPLSTLRALDPRDASVAQTQPPPATPGAPADPAANSEDAIRHAKRAACRKDARDKKLVGAQRTAYIKDCTALP
jgi:hypothetical protein